MPKQIKRMFWDIETSPNLGYFWRPGYKVRLDPDNIVHERAVICICWKWEHQRKINALAWDNGDDKKMIHLFLNEAKKADELIAHNGDRFDLTWFQARCLYHGLDTIPEFKTVDTLQISKRHFHFNSHRLDYLAKHLLGKGKIHTDFSLWKNVCQGNTKALQQMVKYCKNDVVILEAVWNKLKAFYKPKTHAGVLQGLARWTCPHDGSQEVIKTKTRVTASGMTRHQMMCKTCGRYYTISNNVYGQYSERN